MMATSIPSHLNFILYVAGRGIACNSHCIRLLRGGGRRSQSTAKYVLSSFLYLVLGSELRIGGKFIFQAIKILKRRVVFLPVGGVLD
jgi:hypothetical protein